jgi:hypothetical protein
MLVKNKLKFLIISFFLVLLFSSCSNNFFRKVDTRNTPINSQERARKNVEEGKGISIESVLKRRTGTNYEFSTSNPMWRASLEILDFLPLSIVDYSGGIITTDWYSDNNFNNNEALKITVRFLSNEIQSNSLKIIIHQKKCITNTNNCSTIEVDSKIKEELTKSILSRASLLEASENKK